MSARSEVRTAKRERAAGEKENANVEIIRGFYEAVPRRDTTAVRAALDPRIEWHEPDGPLPPPAGGGIHRGRAAVVSEVLDSIQKHWAEFKVEPDVFLDAGEHVVVTGRFRCKPSAGGAEIKAPCVQVWRLRDGKAVHMQNYTDTAKFARALGR